jgi:hypothetical protein
MAAPLSPTPTVDPRLVVPAAYGSTPLETLSSPAERDWLFAGERLTFFVVFGAWHPREPKHFTRPADQASADALVVSVQCEPVLNPITPPRLSTAPGDAPRVSADKPLVPVAMCSLLDTGHTRRPCAQGLWLPNGAFARELVVAPMVSVGVMAVNITVTIAPTARYGVVEPPVVLSCYLRLITPLEVTCDVARLYSGKPFITIQGLYGPVCAFPPSKTTP